MIVGTAGHIDHGKTTLVRALTGVDTDRLPQEKARGISIELGYAFLPVPDAGDDERIGFIDVPGHERLVHTMIAGATGIDFALLLVAADDGVMPQTREHLAVLALLGLRRGAVVVTKVDRADAERIAQVHAEIGALLAGTPLARAPVLEVSAQTGAGVAVLRQLLIDAARDAAQRRSGRIASGESEGFRLAIDRAFTLAGIGTVVTGTAHAGRVRVGDELALLPSPAGVRARVRSLHAQNRAVDEAHAGHRCAVALVGIAKDDVVRGQWVVDPEVVLQTDRFDAVLRIWPGEAQALRSGMTVHVHLGAADVMASLAVLQAGDVNSGTDASAAPQTARAGPTAVVQLVLREPVGAWRGDRVIVRDASASRTLAGGVVLDPFAPVRYRRTPQRLAELDALAQPEAAAQLARLVNAAGQGVSLSRWARAGGLRAGAARPLPADAMCVTDAAGDTWALGAAQAGVLVQATLQTLRTLHEQDPEVLGPDAARLRRAVAPRLPDALWKALLATLQREQQLAIRGAFVHLPEHGLRLSAADERLWQKVSSTLADGSFDGHWVRDLARDARESEPLLRITLARLAQRGDVHAVVKDLYYAPATIERLAAIVRSLATGEHQAAVSAAQFRDATGLGRKRAIQILEYFDRIGLLRRSGDLHRLRADTAMFMS